MTTARAWVAIVAALAVLVGSAPGRAGADPTTLAVRITSPLGRAALHGPIRIVAQVSQSDNAALGPVRFFVDEILLGEDTGGPVYAVEWVDDNPFVERRIRVEVADARGRTATDLVTLPPLEIFDAAHVASVLVEATVQDAEGRFVTGLSSPHFMLHEDEVRQTLELVRAETAPITVTLLIDSSQSMRHRFDMVQRAARRFVDRLRPEDRLVVAPFSQTIGAITGPTTDVETVVAAIDAISPRGGTAIVDSLQAVAERLGEVDGRHAIVLLTDGYDEHSRGSAEKAVAAVRASRATLYVVGIGGAAGISMHGRDLLQQLAREGGGRAFFPFRDEELPATSARVTHDMQHRYLISYTPTNQAVDGTWRAIQLVAADPTWAVRARRGYFAPSPPPVRATLELTVTDATRGYANVAMDDLLVIEDGTPQRLDAFHEAVAPVSILLLFDASGSMRSAAEAVRRAGRAFVDAVRPEDSVGVMHFGSHIDLVADLSTRRAPSLAAIDDYTVRGGTPLYDALAEALARLASVDGRRVVVLLTDGEDENAAGDGPGSQRTLEEVLAMLPRAATAVYTVGLGASVDAGVLRRLAQASGGEALFASEVEDLESHYHRILEDLRRRYVVSYTSTNAERNGAWRDVEISTRHPHLVVRSTGGYFAPAR